MPGFFLVTIHVLPAGKPLVVGGDCGFFVVVVVFVAKVYPSFQVPNHKWGTWR